MAKKNRLSFATRPYPPSIKNSMNERKLRRNIRINNADNLTQNVSYSIDEEKKNRPCHPFKFISFLCVSTPSTCHTTKPFYTFHRLRREKNSLANSSLFLLSFRETRNFYSTINFLLQK